MVYIEEVVADNLILNCILLAVSVGLLKDKCVWWRILLSAAIGTLFAVFLPFINKTVIVYKIGALLATTAFALPHKKIKRYILFVLVFSVVSFAAGGAAYGLYNLSVGKNGSLTYPAGKAVKYAVYGAIVFLLVVLRQMKRFAVRKRISALNEACGELLIKNKRIKVKYFNDTGNKLIDNVSSKPVMVISNSVGAHYANKSVRTIEVETVNDKKYLPLFTVDRFTISNNNGEKRVFEKIPVAVADRDFGGYDLIVNLEVLCG